MGGLKCLACRRIVLRRVHIIILAVVTAASVVGLLELLAYLTPPTLKSF